MDCLIDSVYRVYRTNSIQWTVSIAQQKKTLFNTDLFNIQENQIRIKKIFESKI